VCTWLACRDFRDHSHPAREALLRSDFHRTRALAVFAWKRIPAFVLDLWRMLSIAASVGNVGALEELVDNRHCGLTVDACTAAARKGQLGALTWLRSHGCPWSYITCCLAAGRGHLEVL